MAAPSPVPRLTDIIEAIELIRSEMADVTLDAFEPDRMMTDCVRACTRSVIHEHGGTV